MITKEMQEWFEKRTKNHIDLVKKYCKKFAKEYNMPELLERAKVHDQSKFEEPERTPYVYISWRYHMEDEGEKYEIPAEIDDNAATAHHILKNSHHPEFHQEETENILNNEDRDGIPEEALDATGMPQIDLMEMCCDWLAMSEEKGTSIQEWVDKVVNVRWDFTADQVEMIGELCGLL